MKGKFLSLLLALTCVGAGICVCSQNAESVKAEGSYKLSFDSLNSEYCCSQTTNGWWDTIDNQSYSVSNGVLTLNFAAYPQTPIMAGYYNPGVMTTKVNHYYKIEFEMKNSNIDTFQLYVENDASGWTELATIGNEGEGWHYYSYTFKAVKEASNFAFQQGQGLSEPQFRDMYIYEVARDLTYEEEIGELPPLPQGATSWGIDGNPITSTSTFDYEEDKIAKPLYPTSLVNFFTLNGANIAKNPNDFVTGNPFEVVNYHDNQIDFESSNASRYHLTQEYDVEAGKTYYLVGFYKTTEGSGIHIGINNPWSLAVESGSSRQYAPFKLKYTPVSSGKIQFIFQSGYQNLGNARFSVKNMYFGEGLEVNYGSKFANLPEPEEYTDGWKLNDEILTTESINNYGTNENIVSYIANPYYEIKFPLANYVKDTAQDLNFHNIGDADYRILNIEENHKYLVEFDYKTPESAGIKPFICKDETGANWESVGYEGVTSPDKFTKLSYTFTAKFTGRLQLIIQDAYQDKPIGDQKFEVMNYVAYDVMKLRHNDKFTYLPQLPASEDPLLVPQSWMINGEEIDVGSTFNSEKDEIATISYDTPTFTLSFDAGDVTIDPISVKYGEAIGELPNTPEASEGHHYVWGIDGDEINSSTIYNFAENKTATLIKRVNTYKLVFKDGSKVLETRNIDYGSKISTFPDYERDEDYNYHWEIDDEEVDADAEFNYTSNKECRLIKVLKTYTATFKVDDEIIGTAEFNKEGYLEELPAVPAKEGHDGVWNEVTTFPNHDMTVEATYTPKTFEIYFVDDAGNRIAMYRIKYGQAYFEVCPTWPKAPDKEGYTFKSYQIGGKDIALSDVFKYTSNQMIVATYTKNEVKPVEPEKKGCGGSIIAASAVVSGLALAGVTLLILKKKEN